MSGNFNDFQVSGMGKVKVKLPDSVKFKFQASGIYVSRTKLSNNFFNIIVPKNPDGFRTSVYTVQWSGPGFFPNVYTEKAGSPNLVYNFGKGQNYIHKETLLYIPTNNDYSSVATIDQRIDKIEYGTFTTKDGKVKMSLTYHESPIEDKKFEDGRCNELPVDHCPICFMHQYQMHRTKDNVAEKCFQKGKIEGKMKKCYWRKPEPVPGKN